jgi:hypothetical protein
MRSNMRAVSMHVAIRNPLANSMHHILLDKHEKGNRGLLSGPVPATTNTYIAELSTFVLFICTLKE